LALRIVLADDHEMVRRGLKVCLEQEGIEVVGEAPNGIQALRLVRKLNPDVVILDHLMPKLNGIEAARQILRESPHARIIILTMRTEERLVLEALQAGVLGYVVKVQAIEDLISAVYTVARREVYLSSALARVAIKAFLDKTKLAADPLSARERQVLQLIAEGNTTKEIADVLGISVKTADSHRSRIRKKLDMHDTADLVRYAIRQGLTQA
jgi:DNA-binding NarL/FixJ family response regulator